MTYCPHCRRTDPLLTTLELCLLLFLGAAVFAMATYHAGFQAGAASAAAALDAYTP